jgi:hypothetical protein
MLELIMLPTNEESQILSEFSSEIPQFGYNRSRYSHQNHFLYLVDTYPGIFANEPAIFYNLESTGKYSSTPELILAKPGILIGKYLKSLVQMI